ncbi:alpha-latrocrustotoxin-Lt1a [Fusarium beomiforme]|uniref:Alpha-latrocrustotoxin-Lt1a n=1 Tax=Fusarium beomiforme TaxID=44412 RepID=A0A9P5AP12_9HYPO|nr:alpha-latrocrustotoxin-Lt1a [Fusarium beomiforme]
MASIQNLPIEAIYHIADLVIEESFNENIFAKTQLALAQTNHHFYGIVNPRLRAASLCWAAREGRLDILKKAHEDGADLSSTGVIRPGERGTPLHYAIQHGHPDVVEYLIEVRVDPHMPSKGLCDCWADGEDLKPYALHMAIQHSLVEGAKKLLVKKLGAYWTFPGKPALEDIDPGDDDDKEIIDLLVNLPGSGPAADALRYALKWGEPELLDRVLKRPDLDASVPDADGQTPLLWAVYHKKVDAVKLLIRRPEVNPGTPPKSGFTALHVAVSVRSLPLVELLLRCPEVDIHKTDQDNATAFHIATERGELEIVNLLLEQPGIDAASPDAVGMTPLHWAVKSRNRMYHPPNEKVTGEDETCTEPPEYRTESLDIVKRLLARPEANAGVQNTKGLTPLHTACLIGDYEVAKLLLKREDVDPTARSLNGQTALHIAASNCHRGAKKIMDLLLQKPGVKITDADYDGRTLLHYLCGNHDKEYPVNNIIATILRAGVPIDKVSATGLTAFHQAVCSGYWCAALLLLDLGADPMISKRFKYNNSLLHIILKHSDLDEAKSVLVEKLLSRGIEIDTYTDSPVYDPRTDEDDKIENVVGILSPDILIGTDCTPLLLTATRDYCIKSMEILLNAGADPNAQVIIRDARLENKTKSKRQAFLSGVFRHTWDPYFPGDIDFMDNEEPLEVLLQHGSRIDHDGPADSPLQEACKAAEEGRFVLLEMLLRNSTEKNVSKSHVEEVIAAYGDKPEHARILHMLEEFERRVFIE